jgi:hypothetical protein
MSSNRRPLAVLLVSCLYMAVGAVGFIVNFNKLRTLQTDSILIELTESLAFIAGLYMFRGRKWARWLALGWMAFHVAISFPEIRQVLAHSMILALIAWVLFRPDVRGYFRSLRPHSE